MRGCRAALAASALLTAFGGHAAGAEVVLSEAARSADEAAASMFMDAPMATP